MRLPGTRYQEHGWEQVRKLLGQCSLQAFARADPALLLDPAQQPAQLDAYTDAVAAALRAGARSARAQAAGNSYGESVLELSLALVYELQAHGADWSAFVAAFVNEHRKIGAFWHGAGGDAILRKKVNDMYAVLRDKVDADNYQAACGRACSANKMYTYRMLDTAYGEVARLFADWQQHQEQVAAILGRAVAGIPIEVRQMKSIAGCKADWIINWSATLERFSCAAGPLHTRSKRFASLRNSPAKVQEMLLEIGAYEELSSNLDHEWRDESADWLDDYWRVMHESEAADSRQADQILPAGAQDEEEPPPAAADEPYEPAGAADYTIAESLSLPPRFMQMASQAQDRSSWTAQALHDASLAVRLAVYLKLLGSADDSYPSAWLDPATGELPTMAQLAALDQVSLPTLRKRRDQAIAALQAAPGPSRRTI